MKGVLYGAISKPAVAVVGVWDPFLERHRLLLERLRSRAKETCRSSLGILLHPSPGSISDFRWQYGTFGWPEYDSVAARIEYMRGCGLDGVLCVHFRKRDFKATAAEFLDHIRTHTELAAIWLGALQLLGPGIKGSRAAVADYATRCGIELTTVSPPPAPEGCDIRSLLAAGRLTQAISLVGHAPSRERPPTGSLRLAWQPGRYRVIALRKNDCIQHGRELDIDLSPGINAPATLNWPSRAVSRLQFISGPSDCPVN